MRKAKAKAEDRSAGIFGEVVQGLKVPIAMGMTLYLRIDVVLRTTGFTRAVNRLG
jgi:hypothetical protein